MQRILIIPLFLLPLLAGCGLIQQIVAVETDTPQVILPTRTPAPTILASSPPSPVPLATNTAVIAPPTIALATPVRLPADPVGAAPSQSSRKYVVQPGSPRWLPNFSHPELGCNYLGIAGQIFDRDGLPAKMLVVEAGGVLQGTDLFALSLSGITQNFGPGGFEIILSDHVIESNDSVWVQVYDLQGLPLSERVFVDTLADCQRNLALVNFVEFSFSEVQTRFFLPAVFNSSQQ
ncbi:MAG TPA: hypothetical protein VIK64_01025 [Anaerolineales bacterium]